MLMLGRERRAAMLLLLLLLLLLGRGHALSLLIRVHLLLGHLLRRRLRQRVPIHAVLWAHAGVIRVRHRLRYVLRMHRLMWRLLLHWVQALRCRMHRVDGMELLLLGMLWRGESIWRVKVLLLLPVTLLELRVMLLLLLLLLWRLQRRVHGRRIEI